MTSETQATPSPEGEGVESVDQDGAVTDDPRWTRAYYDELRRRMMDDDSCWYYDDPEGYSPRS